MGPFGLTEYSGMWAVAKWLRSLFSFNAIKAELLGASSTITKDGRNVGGGGNWKE